MSRFHRPSRPLPALLIAAALLWPPGARAQLPEWNQERVASLAGQLVQAIGALLADPALEARQDTAMQQREHEAAISSARELERLAVAYQERVAGDYDREDSRPFWDQMATLRGDIRSYARHSWLPSATREKAERVNGVFDQLARYYSDV